MSLSFLAEAALCPVLPSKMLFLLVSPFGATAVAFLQRAYFRSISMENAIGKENGGSPRERFYGGVQIGTRPNLPHRNG
mgnify:CR=1 FL=1